jgi:RNA polymerase sigma factor (sigma-70 family)
MVDAVSARQEDEERIVTLLQALHTLPDEPIAAREAVEKDILALVDRHFRVVLKPFLLSRFGAVAGERGVIRYTAMMNDFFVKVLARRPDEFWRARDAATLRKWASVVVSNQMRDYLRRKKLFEDQFDAIAPLVEERCDFFQEKTDRELTVQALDLIDSWCKSDDKTDRSRGWVLRHRFVDGMTREQIADQLNLSVHAVRQALAAGIETLKTILNK